MGDSRDTDVELVSADGVRLAARFWPAADLGLGYVVAHGFTGASSRPALAAICRRLVAGGAAVLAPDLRGHGRSGGASTVGALENLDIDAGVTFLRQAGYRRVASLGFSMGGSAVLRQAGLAGSATGERRHDASCVTADAVVAVSSPGLWFERGTVPMRRLHLAVETRLGRRLLRRLNATRIGGSWDDLPQAPVELVGRIDVPLLVVHGDSDAYFPLRHPRALAAASHAELWIEAGMGHAETATTPELVDRIDEWVRSALSD